jgi:hypothetical protein
MRSTQAGGGNSSKRERCSGSDVTEEWKKVIPALGYIILYGFLRVKLGGGHALKSAGVAYLPSIACKERPQGVNIGGPAVKTEK